MSVGEQKRQVFFCKYDSTPLEVSHGDGGFFFAIDDEENCQGRQVMMKPRI